jgi:taurine dioxygenase
MTTTLANSAVSWTPVTKHFGAEVDIDLNDKLSSEVIEELCRLFDERQLLIFRKQDIDYETQRRTVGLFGNLLPEVGDAKYVSTIHDVEGNPVEKPRDIDPRATEFHSDLTFMQVVPIRGISLYGLDVSDTTTPIEGTRFVSTRKAYLDLPESARAELANRTSIHLHGLGLTVEEQKRLSESPLSEVKDKVDFWAEHPMFFPSRSTEPVLFYVPWFAHSIVGMSPAESRKWFDLFDSLLYQEDNIYTHQWRQYDLLVWDNVALQHGKQRSANSDGPVPKRVLRRAIFGTEAYSLYNAGYSYDAERDKRDARAS